MGISELLKILKPVTEHKHISEFFGQTAAVDMMAWLYRGLYASAVDHGNGIESDIYLNFPLKMLSLLRENNIKPIAIFDGNNLQAKDLEHTARRDDKEKSLEAAHKHQTEGNHEESKKNFRRALKVKSKMINTLIEIIKKLDIQVIVAPYEADAQIAYLFKSNLVDFAISEDSDMIVYGVRKTVYKLNADGNCTFIDMDTLANHNDPACRIMSRMKFINFVSLCVMSGCDYLPSIKGFGFKTGLKFFEKYEVLDRVIHNIKYIAKFKDAIPNDYLVNAKKTVSLFFLQLIYDPVEKKLRNLTNIEPNQDDSHDEIKLKEKLSKYNLNDEFYGKVFEQFEDFCKGDLDIKKKIMDKKIESNEIISKYVNRYKSIFNKIKINKQNSNNIIIINSETKNADNNDSDKYFRQLIRENDLDEQRCLHETLTMKPKNTNFIHNIISPTKSDIQEVYKFCDSASKTPSKYQFEIEKPKNLMDLLVQERKTEEKPFTMKPILRYINSNYSVDTPKKNQFTFQQHMIGIKRNFTAELGSSPKKPDLMRDGDIMSFMKKK